MILSVDRDCHQWEEIEDNGEEDENEDSDIPRKRTINLRDYEDDSLGDRDDSSMAIGGYKGRKRRPNSDNEDD